MPIDLGKVSVFCFLASYVVAFGLEWTRLVRRTAIGRWVGFGFGLAGFVAQMLYLWVRSRGHDNLPPLLSSTHDWLLVLAWIVVLLYLFLTVVDRDLAVGLFLLPVVLLFVVSSYFVSKETNALIEGSRGLAMLHATLLVIGIAGVVASFVLSLMYVVQHRRLKQHHAQQPGVLLPSLARLARWNWWGVVISVPLLTLGLGSGVALGLKSKKAEASLSFADPLVIGHGIVWLVMLSLFMWLLTTRRSTGKQVAALTLWACGFLLVILIGLQVLTGEGLSSFHGGAKTVRFVPNGQRRTLTRSVNAGGRFTMLPSLSLQSHVKCPSSLTLFEVALLLRNPEGSQPLAGGRRRRTTGKPAKTSLHPGGMPANLPLASLRDAISTIPRFRWCRFAQPPANRCEPSGLNRKCATLKLTLRVSLVAEASA